MKIKDISKQCELIDNFRGAESRTLDVYFQNTKLTLFNRRNIDYRPFITDQPISTGEPLGTGSVKKVYHINGKAVFLIPCRDVGTIERIIEDEITISKEMATWGILTQTLSKDYIRIYDPESGRYLDYPCMFSDSFSTLSREKEIEIVDTKNMYRFGSKYKLYHSDADCMDNSTNRIIFQTILSDIALLLYLGFAVNAQDSFNLAFIPSPHGDMPCTVKLFMYDFTEKYITVKTGCSPIKILPKEEKIKDLLKSIIKNALEGDHIARHSRRPITTPSYIHTFFDETYPDIETEFIATIQAKILEYIHDPISVDIIKKNDLLEAQKIKFNGLLIQLKMKTRALIAKGTKNHLLFNPHYIPISKTVTILIHCLEQARDQFFVNPNAITFTQFKQDCNAAIKTAETEFKNNRSAWSMSAWNELNPILKGVLGILALLTFLPALMVAMKSKYGYLNTFFIKHSTESFEILRSFTKKEEKLMETIQSFCTIQR